MAVFFDGKQEYVGSVLKIEEHMWMDGMLEEWAVVWDKETHSTKRVTIGYYGIDGSNLAGGSAEVDADEDTIRDVLRTLKSNALEAVEQSVIEFKTSIKKGSRAEVVRGRKVPKGTILNVFWVGERPTYRSRNYSWMDETEEIAGCYTESGEKIWIKTEYLKSLDDIKSPNAKERNKFVKAYVRKRAEEYGIKGGFVG